MDGDYTFLTLSNKSWQASKSTLASTGFNKSGAGLFRCLVCKKMVTKYTLKNHLSIHNGETKFKCNFCPKAYLTKSSLANHKVASHQDTKKRGERRSVG